MNTKKLLTLTCFVSLFAPAQAQQDTSEPVVIDGKRFKIIIYEKDKKSDSTSQSDNVIRIETGTELGKNKDVEIIPYKPKMLVTKWNVLEIGLNNTMNNSNFEMPSNYAEMELNGAKSINFHWGIIQHGLNLYRGKIRLVYGLGIEYNNYRFKNNIDLVKDSKPLEVVVNTNRDYSKNKLVTQYLTVPLMINYKSNPEDEDHSFNVSAGVQAGYLFGSHQKQKWSENGNEKRKVRDDFNLSDYRFGYVLSFGYGNFNLYAKYYPTPMFQDAKGPEIYAAAAGIVLSAF